MGAELPYQICEIGSICRMWRNTQNTHLPCQSTPSLRKVTCPITLYTLFCLFQSTPSLRKVTHVAAGEGAGHGISIHTFLTEGDVVSVRCAGAMVISIHTFLAEGDNKLAVARYTLAVFQSTPSLQKVTEAGCRCGELYRISIHTFFAEGDVWRIVYSTEL